MIRVARRAELCSKLAMWGVSDRVRKAHPNISWSDGLEACDYTCWDCKYSFYQTVLYPMDKVEVLVGNDMSEDKTGEIAEAYAIRYPSIQYINIYFKIKRSPI